MDDCGLLYQKRTQQYCIAAPPSVIALWTRLVSALAVVSDTPQLTQRSRGVGLRTTTQRRHSLQKYQHVSNLHMTHCVRI